MRTHVDLFTGIGGFTLACSWNGVRTVVMCESDERRRAFLERRWPGIPVYDDIRTFHWPMADTSLSGGHDAEKEAPQEPNRDGSHGRIYLGDPTGHSAWTIYGSIGPPVWLLTAGVPCQPASRAGKQRGAADDRWLWPQALRVLREVQPTWAILENPPGIRDLAQFGVSPPVDGEGNPVGNLGDVFTRSGPGHLHTILEEIKALGYEVEPVPVIPACAINAPHRRARYWIVAHRSEPGRVRAPQHGDGQQDCSGRWGHDPTKLDSGQLADAERERRQRRGTGAGEASRPLSTDRGLRDWSRFVWLPCADGKLRRAPDDSFGVVDGLHRSLLAALGDSIVPQVAARIIEAMISAERELREKGEK